MALFSGQTAVITGAGSGIGRAIAMGLGTKGASFCLVGRNEQRLASVASELQKTADVVRTFSTDLSVDPDVLALIDAVKGEYGRVDLLIHCAGDFSMGLIDDSPISELDRQYRVNFRAPYLLTQGLLPLIRAHAGQIVFINSSAGLNAKAKVSQYAATKHALRALADSLREEVNPDGVRVLSVYPGRTATPMQETVHVMEGRAYIPENFMQPDDVASVVIHALSLPRTAEVTDIHIRPLVKT